MRGLVVVAVAAAVVQGSVVDIDSVVDSESAFAKLDAWAFGDEMDLTPGLASGEAGEASRDDKPFTRESALLAEAISAECSAGMPASVAPSCRNHGEWRGRRRPCLQGECQRIQAK